MFLTIAIPTWNRPNAVRERLAELSLQMHDSVEVVIYENGESEATSAMVAPYLNANIHYAPCPKNQGACHNFLRCIQERDSEWLWVLGDDDAILPNSISTLIEWLENNRNASFITTRSIHKAQGAVQLVHNTKELFLNTTFSDALFFSGTVWKRSDLREHIGVFVDSAYSMSPNICAMLNIIDNESFHGVVYFDSLVLPKITDHRWSRLAFLKRLPAVFDFVESEESRKITVGAIWPAWLWAARDSMKELDSHAKKAEWKNSFWTGFGQFSPYFGLYKHPIWVVFFLLINSPFRNFAIPWKVAGIISNRLVASKLMPSPIKS